MAVPSNCSFILRARYREREPQLLEPGRIYRLEIDLWATANRFKAGHRLRVDIARQIFRISTATVTAAANLVNPSARSRASIATGSIRLICCCQCCAVVQFPLGLRVTATMQNDIRDSDLYREAEAVYLALRRPGTGQISDAAEIHASPGGRHAVFTGTLVDMLQGAPPTRICQVDLTSSAISADLRTEYRSAA